MAEGIPQPEIESRLEATNAPRWVVAAIVVLSIAVVLTGVLLVLRWNARKAEATLVQDPRVTVLRGLVRANPQDDASRNQLAQVYLQAGLEDQALREYEAVLKHSPDDMTALYNVGVLRLDKGDTKQGEKALARALELQPTHAYAALALAEHYSSTRQFAASIAIAKPAADEHQTLADLQYLTAEAYEQTGQTKLAAQYYRRALKVVPGMRGAREALNRLGGAK